MAACTLSVLDRFLLCSSRKSERDSVAEEKGTVHITVGFFLFVNYMLITTFLGLPFAFFHGGILAGLLTLAVIGTASRITANWVMEVTARAQVSSLSVSHTKCVLYSTARLQALNEHKETPYLNQLPNFRLTHERKFEIVNLCEIFLGRWGKYIIIVLITAGCFVYLVGSSAVVGSTLSVNIPLDFAGMRQCNSTDFHMHVLPSDISCRNAYWFCLFLLAVIVVPLSMVSITKQAALQVAMGAFRFITIGAILIFVIVNSISFGSICSCDQPWRPSSTNSTIGDYNDSVCGVNSTVTDMLFHFQFDTWITLIPLTVSCFTIHMGLPSLTHPLKQKKHLGALLNAMFLTMGLLYMAIGVAVPMWWKNCIIENCTLNWVGLHYCYY